MRLSKTILVPLALAALLTFHAAGQHATAQDNEELRAGKIAIKAARIITVADDEIENGVILVENGRIKDVGKDLQIPFDYWVVDAGDKVVFPGFVEAHSYRGLSGYINRFNESLPVVPFLDVDDGIDPSSLEFEDALRDGVTAMLVTQGNNTVIGAMSRIIKPIGRSVDEMSIKAEAGLKISFAPMSGQDRMTQMALFRETFRELAEYRGNLAESKYEKDLEKKDKKVDVAPEEARKRGMELIEDEDYDFKHLRLHKLANGRLAAFAYCERAMDVTNAIKTAKENGFLDRLVFVLGNDCHKAVNEIKAVGRPVILDAGMVHREEDPFTGEETETFVPVVFYEAGVPFAVMNNPNDVLGARYAWYQAARLVRNGIPRDDALKAVTLTAASIIGVGNRVGAILPGYDASLLVLTGDPLDAGTWVDQVILDGVLVYERSKDHRLKELLTGREVKPEEEEEGEKAPADDDAEGSAKPAEGTEKPAEAGEAKTDGAGKKGEKE